MSKLTYLWITQKLTRNEKGRSGKRNTKSNDWYKKQIWKNAILKGMNLQKEGTTIERNRQIGGHKE